MQAGLIARYDALEFRLRLGGGGNGNASASLVADALESPTQYRHYLLIELYRDSFSPLTAATVFLWNPTTQQMQTLYSDSLNNDVEWEIEAHLLSPRYYARVIGGQPRWELHTSGVQVYRNNSLVYSDTQTRVYISNYFAPAGVPVLGLAPEIAANAAAQVPLTAGSASRTATATGGWRVRIGTQYHAYPVAFNAGSGWDVSQLPCSDCVPPFDPPTDTDTWSVVVAAHQSVVVTATQGSNSECSWSYLTGASRGQNVRARALPNLPRAYVGLTGAEPSLALVQQLAFPSARRLATYLSRRAVYVSTSNYCGYQTSCETNNSVETIVYAAQPAAVRTLSPSGLDPEIVYAPLTLESVCSYEILGQIITDCAPCNPPFPTPDNYWADARLSYPHVDSAPAYYNPATGDATIDALARYINTWAHPHWLYLLRFSDWSLGVPLTPAPADDYWRLLQQQWLGDSALPPAERTKQRNLCCLEPLTTTPYDDWISNNLMGYRTLWAGACRFDVLHTPAVSQQQLTSASQPRWAITNASAVFGINIAVTPTASISTLEFDLTDWQIEPYLYPALCSAVRVQVTGVYNRVRVYLVNFEGDAHELQPDPNDATKYLYAPGQDSVYAGDWAQSYAAQLAGYSETGFDLKPEGRSSSVMTDPARRTLWELLHSQTPAKLRIVVEQTAPSPYTLAYPTFYREFAESKAYPLTAHTQAVVDHDALWRHGGLNFQLTTPAPQLRPVHQSPTVYDALCLRNLLYRGESYQHQMTADANAFYDSVEWTGAFADLRMDTRSLIYPLHRRYTAPYLSPEPLLVLINAYREVPPLACLPRRKRDAETLAEVGDWGQWQYLISPLRRYYVGLDQPIHLHRVEYDSSGNETGRLIATTYLEAFRRAHIAYHELALDNNEIITRWDGQPLNSPRYLVHCKGDDWARVTPFHGYSAVIALSPQAPPDYLPIEVDGRRRWLVWGAGDTLQTAHIAQFALWLTAPHSVDAWRWIAWDSRHGAYLLTAQVGNEWRVYLSRDGGETVQEVLSMQAETLLCESYSAAGLWVALYQTSAGVFVRYSSDGGQSWSSPQTVLLDGVAMTQTPTGLAYDERGGLLLMTYQVGNQRHVAVSYDAGATWATVL